jgi:hypothetical protein
MQRVCQLIFAFIFNRLDYSNALDAVELESHPAIRCGPAQHDPPGIGTTG